jgi:uncharacterized protein (DUF2164 family)
MLNIVLMKNTKSLFRQSEHLLLFLLLLLVFLAPFFVFNESGLDWNKVISNWRDIAPFIILVLINHFLLVPLLLFKNKKSSYFLASFVLLILFSISLHFLASKSNSSGVEFDVPHPPPPHLAAGKLPHPPPPLVPQKRGFAYPPYLSSFIISILLLGFDSGLRMNFRWSKLEKERTELEKENIENQLAFLKNQVSPHFFMNTLNNIHALIDVNTEEAKEAIIKLSKLMRHLLYESEAEKIPIKKELEFIESYINLMKLRFSEKVSIELQIPQRVPDKNIAPLLFTSFVENAFKHGISYQNPSFIKIEFHFEEDRLSFKLENTIADQKIAERGGIGIENSRKRLDILYGDQYTLDIEEVDQKYYLNLNIPI